MNHKSQKGFGSSNRNERGTTGSVNNVSTESSSEGQEVIKLGSTSMTQEQVSTLTTMIEKVKLSYEHAVGMMCLSSIKSNNDFWIIDSGATNHITPHMNILWNILFGFL